MADTTSAASPAFPVEEVASTGACPPPDTDPPFGKAQSSDATTWELPPAGSDSPSPSHFRRWYLRPWVILLTAMILLITAYSVHVARRCQALAMFKAAGAQVSFECVRPLEPLLSGWVPEAVYGSMISISLVLPVDRSAAQSLLDQLQFLPEVAYITLRSADVDLRTEAGRQRVMSLRELGPSDLHRLTVRLPQLSRVSSLCIQDLMLDDQTWQWLAGRRILDLDIRYVTLSSLDTTRISRIRSIMNLNLDSCAITAESLSPLSGLSSLFVLSISGPHVTDDVVQALPSFLSLRDLSVHRGRLSSSGLQTLTRSPLTSLTLSNMSLTDDDLRGLAHEIPTLTELKLNGLSLTEAVFDSICVHRNLESIEVEFTGDEDAVLAKLVTLSRLQSLKLNLSEIDVAALRARFAAPSATRATAKQTVNPPPLAAEPNAPDK